jgi:hypothetical protein
LEQIPFRVEKRLAGLLGIQEGQLSIVQGQPGDLPALRCELTEPVETDLSLVIRVHARTGVPLAVSAVSIARGDRAFETKSLTMLAMEGYSHLRPVDRHGVEGRVWSRRAYATATAT